MVIRWVVSPGALFFLLAASVSTRSSEALAYSPATSSERWSKTTRSSRPPLLVIPRDSTALPAPAESASISSPVRQQHQRQQKKPLPRAAFLRSVAFAGTSLLLGGAPPATAAATSVAGPSQDDPSAKFQAGLANLDRAVSKEAKKIDRAVTKEKKNISKEIKKGSKKLDKSTQKATKTIQKEVKKIDKKTQKATKGIKKETKKVMREVDKETEKVRREAKKIGSGLEQKAGAFVGGNGGAAVPQANSGGGIDVSKIKVCDDNKKKCLR